MDTIGTLNDTVLKANNPEVVKYLNAEFGLGLKASMQITRNIVNIMNFTDNTYRIKSDGRLVNKRDSQ